MGNELYWEDVKEGAEIPAISKIATTQTLVKWAAGCGDFIPLHYDWVFMTAQGVGKPLIHGGLKRQWMVQMLVDWTGDPGCIRKLSCEYRKMDYPRPMKNRHEPLDGETWRTEGRVARKYVEGGVHYIDCDIWVKNGLGEVTTPGKATLIMPSKS